MRDFVRDNNPAVIAALGESMPSFVKDAGVMTEEDLQELSPSAFADPSRRLHPIHTKEAAYLSAAYLYNAGVVDGPVVERVKTAAAAFGITADIESAFEALASIQKQASAPEARYAMYVDADPTSGNAREGYYPINIGSEVQDSARMLAADFDKGKIPGSWFKSASEAILDRAIELGVDDDIFPTVKEAGTRRVPNFEVAESLVNYRHLGGAPGEQLDLYRDIVKAASEDEENLPQYVDLMEDLDRQLGVKYASSLVPPAHSLFYRGEKVEVLKSAADNTVCVADVLIPLANFARLPEKPVRMMLTKSAADAVMEAVKSAHMSSQLANEKIGALPTEVQKQILGIATQMPA